MQDVEAYEDNMVSQQEAVGAERTDAQLRENGHPDAHHMRQPCSSAGLLAVTLNGPAHTEGCAAVVELRSIAAKWLKQLNSGMNGLR